MRIYSYKTPLEEIKREKSKGIICLGTGQLLPWFGHIFKELFELGSDADYAMVHNLCSIYLAEVKTTQKK